MIPRHVTCGKPHGLICLCCVLCGVGLRCVASCFVGLCFDALYCSRSNLVRSPVGAGARVSVVVGEHFRSDGEAITSIHPLGRTVRRDIYI